MLSETYGLSQPSLSMSKWSSVHVFSILYPVIFTTEALQTNLLPTQQISYWTYPSICGINFLFAYFVVVWFAIVHFLYVTLSWICHGCCWFGTSYHYTFASCIITMVCICDRICEKKVFHTHPLYQLWQFIASDSLMLLTWNLVCRKHQHRWIAGESFNFICLDNQVMVFQVYRIGCTWKTRFRKFGHTYWCCCAHEFYLKMFL